MQRDSPVAQCQLLGDLLRTLRVCEVLRAEGAEALEEMLQPPIPEGPVAGRPQACFCEGDETLRLCGAIYHAVVAVDAHQDRPRAERHCEQLVRQSAQDGRDTEGAILHAAAAGVRDQLREYRLRRLLWRPRVKGRRAVGHHSRAQYAAGWY